jgi:hypothetical protein
MGMVGGQANFFYRLQCIEKKGKNEPARGMVDGQAQSVERNTMAPKITSNKDFLKVLSCKNIQPLA